MDLGVLENVTELSTQLHEQDGLSRSDPETVADAADISTSRARDWIDQVEA